MLSSARLATPLPSIARCARENWWRNDDKLTTPGEQAAAALVSIGSRTIEPLLAALQQPQWVTRRNAAWALGALDDARAVKALIESARRPGAGRAGAGGVGARGHR